MPSPAPLQAFSWLLLAAAFSPVLIDLFGHLAQRPWAAYSLVFLPLFLLELSRSPRREARARLGWAVLGASLIVELLLVGSGFTRAARLAFVLAALGLSWIQGRPAPRTLALLVLFVPIPHALVSWGHPALAATWADGAVALLQLLGKPALVEAGIAHATLFAGTARIPLNEADGGLPVVALLFGLVWYVGCARSWSLPRTLLRALTGTLLAAPLQVLALTAAGALAAEASATRLALDVGPWATVTIFALLGAWRPNRHRTPDGREPLSSSPP